MSAPAPARNAVTVVDESTLRSVVPFIPFMLNMPPPAPPKVADEDSLEGAALLVGVVISTVESETWDEVRLRRWPVAIEFDVVAEMGERRA